MFLGFALSLGGSGYLCFLGMAAELSRGQLHFSRTFLIPNPNFQVHSSQAGAISLSVLFSRHFLLLSNFPLLRRNTSDGSGAGALGRICCAYTQCLPVLANALPLLLIPGSLHSMETEIACLFQLQAS